MPGPDIKRNCECGQPASFYCEDRDGLAFFRCATHAVATDVFARKNIALWFSLAGLLPRGATVNGLTLDEHTREH